MYSVLIDTNAKDCTNKINLSIKNLIMTSRKKNGNNSSECPPTALCFHHHSQFKSGTDVTLKNGKKKTREEHKIMCVHSDDVDMVCETWAVTPRGSLTS